MARTKQTARKPREEYWPKRGVPRLATYEPIPLPRSPPRLRKKPGAKRRTAIKKFVEAKVVESPKPFYFLGLPAELRNTIYELCVSVSNYIIYDDRDFCTCGQPFIDNGTDEDHDKDGCSCTFKVARIGDPDYPGETFFPRLSARFYVLVGDMPNKLTSPLSPILRANSQIRKEALPIFFAMNDFAFEKCSAMSAARWLFNAVQPHDLRHIKSISWNVKAKDWSIDEVKTGLLTVGSLELCSVIMLMQLGVLSNCKVRFSVWELKSVHIACFIHKMIKPVVQRRLLTRSDAENEEGVLEQLEVEGLAYTTSKKFTSWLVKVWNESDLHNPSSYCDCTAPNADHRPPFVMMGSSARSGEAAGHHSAKVA